MIRFSIFNNATMLITYFETLVHGIDLWFLLYFLPLFYETCKEYTPIISGVAMPLNLASLLVSASPTFPPPLQSNTSPSLLRCCRHSLHRHRPLALGHLGRLDSHSLGSRLLYLPELTTFIPGWVFLNVPVAIGTGMLSPAMAIGIQAAGRSQDAGHAVAFYSFTRVFGQFLGVAIGVLFSRTKSSKN
jgi:hypothetical protein